ncbi:MAG: glutathione S-transferase C-terminal domain-containing protein, partial [Solirubrobacteraceae bacterium]
PGAGGAFGARGARGASGARAELDLYPEALRGEIDAVNERVYDTVNNGVYKAGFARRQDAYEAAFRELFASLAWLEDLLGQRRYLAGERITEADWRAFPTLVRFDEVYHVHFRCNYRRIVEYPNLWAYTRELYQWPAVAETVAMDQIKRHYYTTHAELNPKGIIPRGPQPDWLTPHGRGEVYHA